MAIPVHLHPSVDPSGKHAREERLERCLAACRNGDLREQMYLAGIFKPLIHSLAEKRAGGDLRVINHFCARGREGLYEAARNYRPKIGAGHFQVFALNFIERAMDGPRPGFWKRFWSHP